MFFIFSCFSAQHAYVWTITSSNLEFVYVILLVHPFVYVTLYQLPTIADSVKIPCECEKIY